MKYARKMMLVVAVLAMVAVTVSSASAAYITGVTIEDASGHYGIRSPEKTIDGSGFDPVTGYHSKYVTDMFLDDAGGDDPLITFDLEGNYDLASVTVWNSNGSENTQDETGRGANSVDILIASSVGGAWTNIGNFTFTQAPWSDTVDFGQVINLTSYAAAGDARLVRFDILSNHGLDGYTCLSEVRFTEVPEPATMSLLGIGGLLALVRRRRK